MSKLVESFLRIFMQTPRFTDTETVVVGTDAFFTLASQRGVQVSRDSVQTGISESLHLPPNEVESFLRERLTQLLPDENN